MILGSIKHIRPAKAYIIHGQVFCLFLILSSIIISGFSGCVVHSSQSLLYLQLLSHVERVLFYLLVSHSFPGFYFHISFKMQYKTLVSALLMGLTVSGVAAEAKHGSRGAHGRAPKVAQQPTAVGTASAADASPTAGSGSSSGGETLELNPSLVQTGSESNGIVASASEAGQAASATDSANFINFCAGKTLTNGLQNIAGSCNGIVMGDIPAKTNMVSTVITFPQNGQTIAANQTFNFSSTTTNMIFGAFTNAKTTYYSAPQQLDPSTGNIIGHLHFTVQAMSDANTVTPLDPTVFAFFKGVNDAGDGKGDLQAIVTGGLGPGNYRVCTMTSSSNHQPVIMPVAQ